MLWTCTFYKVQGLSLTEGAVRFDLESQKPFNQGQMYVALSRITSINELYLIVKYNKAGQKAYESANRVYESLSTESCFKSQLHSRVTESDIVISLLNTHSFKTHFRDISVEKHLLDNDILCLTETQVEINDDTYMTESALERQFKTHFHSNINNFKSIAYGYSRKITILSNEDLMLFLYLLCKEKQFSSSNINEVIRAVLNSLLFYYKKILHTPTPTQTQTHTHTHTHTKSSLHAFR